MEAPAKVFVWLACAVSGLLLTWLAVILSFTGPGSDEGVVAGLAGLGAFSVGALACLLAGRAINKGWLGYLAGMGAVALFVVFLPVVIMAVSILGG